MNIKDIKDIKDIKGVKETKVYKVWSNTNLTDGRGGSYVRYICAEKATAIRLGKGGYVQGSDCNITEDTAYVINGNAIVTDILQ